MKNREKVFINMSALQNNSLGSYNPNDFLENIDAPLEEIDE